MGDAAFQNKCIGKMSAVAQSGPAVLFVSHSMAAVRQLCTRAIHINEGAIINSGDTESVIRSYLRDALPEDMGAEIEFEPDPAKPFQMLKIRLLNEHGDLSAAFHCDEPVIVELESISRHPVKDLYGYFAVTHTDGTGTVVLVSDSQDIKPNAFDSLLPGVHRQPSYYSAGAVAGRW